MARARRFDDLAPETQAFLASLQPDEINILSDGIRLVSAIRTVGRAAKWCTVGLLGIFAGIVGLGEAMVRIVGWFRP